MARQKLGMAAKSKVASVRITPAEEGVLTLRFGTPSKALRAFVNQVMDSEQKPQESPDEMGG